MAARDNLQSSNSNVGAITVNQRISNSVWACFITVGDVESATFLVRKSGNGGVSFNGISATTDGVEVTVKGNATYNFIINSSDGATFTYGYLTQVA